MFAKYFVYLRATIGRKSCVNTCQSERTQKGPFLCQLVSATGISYWALPKTPEILARCGAALLFWSAGEAKDSGSGP
jgi:hypothetical protein